MKKLRFGKLKIIRTGLLALLLASCGYQKESDSWIASLTDSPSLEGKKAYLSSPFVTAGDRVYLVGFQDGSFPDLGWHIPGEMGGIWDHPIKLMDGFEVTLLIQGKTVSLEKADRFVNYPIGNTHHYTLADQEIEVNRFQFVPDGEEGLLVEFEIVNNGKATTELDFRFTGRVDLRPTWLGERTNMIDGPDSIWYDKNKRLVVAKDRNNPWYVAFTSSSRQEFSEARQPNAGNTASGALTIPVSVPAKGRKLIQFAVAGSYTSELEAKGTALRLVKDARAELEEKKLRYESIRQQAELVVPDSSIQTLFEWTKYNTDWLVRDVPEIGRGLSAGLPDYPWWFGCDNTYSQQGVLAIGQHELTKSTIKTLIHLSRKVNNNGRIVHEVSTNGEVYNPGNVNETPHFIFLLSEYYRWTGDIDFIHELYPDVIKGIEWLEAQDKDGNGNPNGAGMMEIHGLDSEMIDVIVYSQQAYEGAAYLATVMGDSAKAKIFQEKAVRLKQKINDEWWVEQAHSYADFIGTPAEALKLVNDAAIRADTLLKPWSVKELASLAERLKKNRSMVKSGHVVYHNWVVNTPMEMGLATPEKAAKALVTARQYTNPFGMYVTGIDRSEEDDSVVLKSRKKTFSYVGAVMTLPTGVQAVAEARYGNSDEALAYLHQLSRSFSYALPGSMYEVSPDFGMIAQAWNLYAVAVPVVRYFFGIHPDAAAKSVFIQPNLPTAWNRASLRQVRVGENVVSVSIIRQAESTTYTIEQSIADWKITLSLGDARKVMVNQQQVNFSTGQTTVQLTGGKNTVEVLK